MRWPEECVVPRKATLNRYLRLRPPGETCVTHDSHAECPNPRPLRRMEAPIADSYELGKPCLATVNLCHHHGPTKNLRLLRTYRFREGWPSRGKRRQRFSIALQAYMTRPGPVTRPRLSPTFYVSAE